MSSKKKAVSIICIIVALGVLAGGLVYFFTKRGDAQTGSPVVVTTGTQEETEKKEAGSLKDTTKITVPLAVIEEKYQNNLDALCEEYGYASAKLNPKDQTVTIKMKTISYELLLTKIGMRVIRSVYDVAESGDYPFVKKIESIDTESFRKVVIKVSSKKYAKDPVKAEAATSSIGYSCLYYQVHTKESSYKCEVLVLDSKTGDLIETKTYSQ